MIDLEYVVYIRETGYLYLVCHTKERESDETGSEGRNKMCDTK